MRIWLLLLVSTSQAAARCEPWCTAPCGALNGDVSFECGGCGAESACRPGAAGYVEQAKAAAAKPKGGASSQRQQQPTRSYTVDLDARLEGLRAAVAARPAEVETAGGASVPCEFARVRAADLAELSPAEIEALLMARPTVVTGLIESWPALATWAVRLSPPTHAAARFAQSRAGPSTRGR